MNLFFSKSSSLASLPSDHLDEISKGESSVQEIADSSLKAAEDKTVEIVKDSRLEDKKSDESGSKKKLNPNWALLFFVCAVFLLQGCSEKKVYTLDEPGADTASLSFPEFIQIRGIDGESVESFFSRMIYEGQNEVVFPAGSHEIELRYNDIWDIDDNDHEKIQSRYILLQFDAKVGGQYKLNIDPPNDRQDAKTLASHFKLAVIDARTGRVVSRFIAEE